MSFMKRKPLLVGAVAALFLSVTGVGEQAASSANTNCAPTPGYYETFCDGFDGTTPDTTLWSVNANSGTVSESNGSITLSSTGPTFPYLVAKPRVLPLSGDYRLTIGFQYDSVGLYGDGVAATNSAIQNGESETDTPASLFAGRVWQDSSGLRVDSNSSCSRVDLPAPDLNPHVAELDYEGKAVEISMDGRPYGRCILAARPVSLWLGNPATPATCQCEWSTLSIDYVRVDIPRSAVSGYVALGDSFSSGEGNPGPTGAVWLSALGMGEASDSGCHRSRYSYPVLVNKWLAEQRPHPIGDFYFPACSGSTTGDLWPSGSSALGMKGASKNHGQPSLQTLASMSQLRTAGVVTVTIGGDDLGFSDILRYCIATSSQGASNALCSKNSTDALVGKLSEHIAELKPILVSTYRRIEADAPNAILYVIGYPDLLPPKPSTAQHYVTCPLHTGIDSVGIGYLAYNEGLLDTAIAQAAHEANAVFVDPNAGKGGFEGHSVCASNAWFNGLQPRHPEYSFHPNHAGQAALAAALEAAISESFEPTPWAGNWVRESDEIPVGENPDFSLTQVGNEIQGTYDWQGCATEVGGSFSGTAAGQLANLTFTSSDGSGGTVTLSLSSNDDGVSGRYLVTHGSCEGASGSFDATRAKEEYSGALHTGRFAWAHVALNSHRRGR